MCALQSEENSDSFHSINNSYAQLPHNFTGDLCVFTSISDQRYQMF